LLCIHLLHPFFLRCLKGLFPEIGVILSEVKIFSCPKSAYGLLFIHLDVIGVSPDFQVDEHSNSNDY
jgi:hypothetical protein